MLWIMLFPTWLNSLKSHYNTLTCSIQRKYFLKRGITFPALVLKSRLTLWKLFRLSMLNPHQGQNTSLFSVSYIELGTSYYWLILHLSFSYRTPPLGLLLFPEKGQLWVNSYRCPSARFPLSAHRCQRRAEANSAAAVQRRGGSLTYGFWNQMSLPTAVAESVCKRDFCSVC